MSRSADPLLIATLGTSLTLNGGWQEPMRLEVEGLTLRPVSVLNFGGGAKASDWGLCQLPAVLASGADIVIVEFSMNDAYTVYDISLERSRDNTAVMIDLLRAAGVMPVLMTMNPTHGAVAVWRPDLQKYYDLYRHIATISKVALIDNALTWATFSAEYLQGAIPDGVHPLPQAVSAVIAPNAARTLCTITPPNRYAPTAQ